MKRRILPLILALALVFALAAPAYAADDPLSFADAEKGAVKPHLDGKEVTVDQYVDSYVAKPNSPEQKIAVYVPDGATKDSPIILLVNNAGWFMDSYNGANHVKSYGQEEGMGGMQTVGDYSSTADSIGVAIARGYVVVTYGCRGRSDAAVDGEYLGHSPATMTDTKAVIRYLRYNRDLLPAGDPEKIVISGTSGGGALSAVIAASGNSPDYYESLYEIGAAGVAKNSDGSYSSTIGDDVLATIAYCPINDLGHACAAYEWTYNETRKTMYAEGTMDYTVQTGFMGTAEYPNATQEAVMAASDALKADYAAYVNTLGLKLADGTALTDKNLEDAIIALMEAEFKDTLSEGATAESMLADIKAADKSDGKLADWLTFNGNNFTYDYAKHLQFLATATTLKVAPSFSNLGMVIAQQNEDNLFGRVDQEYSPYNFYSWNNDATAGNGVGKDDTGLTWEEFLKTDDGNLVAKQIKMSSPIPYLTQEQDKVDTAPYWYVRHGVMDRDTSFALQTVLYYSLLNAGDVEELDFEFAWLKPHSGDYDVPEAYAWLAEVLGEDTAPVAPEIPKVQLSRQPLTVDGEAVDAQAYNIGGNNFFKLRDIAMLLNGTDAQFSVDFDADAGAVIAETGKPYTVIGGELATGEDKSATCVVSTHSLAVDGEKLDATVYNIGGNNYFKLRELGEALGFGVDYDRSTATVLITTK